MARCPDARWVPATRSNLSFNGGPPKIVWHTTEGTSTDGAISAFRSTGYWPHFTVGADEIIQHIDTQFAAFALRNGEGGVETNRDTAYQIEVVGFAGRPKLLRTLANAHRLARWIEETHGVLPVWPNGLPKVAVDGRDPGGHNRNASNWDQCNGHFGHCHVPENTHWDPGFTTGEVAVLMPEPDPEPATVKEYDMGIIANDTTSDYYVEGGVAILLDPDSLRALLAAGVKNIGTAVGLVQRAARYS